MFVRVSKAACFLACDSRIGLRAFIKNILATPSQHNNECLHNHKTACRQTEDAEDETEDKIADNTEGTSEGKTEGEIARKTIEDETEDK